MAEESERRSNAAQSSSYRVLCDNISCLESVLAEVTTRHIHDTVKIGIGDSLRFVVILKHNSTPAHKQNCIGHFFK